jgi:hypothetical protein
VSAANGPSILYLSFFNFLIVGKIILLSSLKLSILSQCGFRPVTPIFIFLLNFSFQKLSISFTLLIISNLLIFLETYLIGKVGG